MSFFGKLKNAISQSFNKDLLEAAIGGAMLVAYADGNCDENELKKLSQFLAALDEFSSFSGTDIDKIINKNKAKFDVDFNLGKSGVLKEIGDISNNPDYCNSVFIVMVGVAKSSSSDSFEKQGDIGTEERQVLREIANVLRLSPGNYGI